MKSAMITTLFWLAATTSHAFVPSTTLRTTRLYSVRDDAIRKDIEEMKQEALRRLDALSEQMDELKVLNQQHEIEETALNEQHKVETTATRKSEKVLGAEMNKEDASAVKHSMHSSSSTQLAMQEPSEENLPCDLLDGTRWKVVFNIGREGGTWMPAQWGASGERLIFQAVVDFTSEPLEQDDEFLEGKGQKLDVVKAFVIPTGVGQESVGRRPVKVKSTGGFKVLKGRGPFGSDIVRFYLELEEDVFPNKASDVYCPKGRVYATCGYFPTRIATSKDSHSWKDILQEEHRALAVQHQNAVQEMDSDSLFSFDRVKHMKKLYQINKQLEKVKLQIKQAQQRQPERSQLRLSTHGDVALSKEGGVCRKVNKGLAFEYHILGRIQVGGVHHIEDHDVHEELVQTLHP
jgi:hypothetical protein